MIAIPHRNVLETIRAQMVLATPLRALTETDVRGIRMADEILAGDRPLVTRENALSLGIRRYFTGEPCVRGHVAERLAANGRCTECKKEWIIENAAHVAQTASVWYRANKEHRSRVHREWRLKNKEYLAQKDKLRVRDLAKKAEDAKKWRKENPAESSRRSGECQKKSLSTPNGALNHRMSVGIANSLRSGKGGKSWQSLVPYTLDQLKTHIERQFLKCMGWNNRHLWHIDHIVPLASFSFTSPDDTEFKAAWAITNLRPLWADKNISKGARREFLL